MSNSKKDSLFDLVKSLSKSEKRHFKLFVNNNSNTDNVKFINLFNTMDSLKEYNETDLLKKTPSIKKEQLSNQKANLYRQILSSLKKYHISQNIDMQLREGLDHAKILYNKGFYLQALKLLDKYKQIAKNTKHYTVSLEMMEFEKLIEAQYITRSISTRADELTDEVSETTNIVSSVNKLSNFTLNLYAHYLKYGYAKNEQDITPIKKYFHEHLPATGSSLNFYESLYLHQSHVWYYNLIQDFPNSYKHSLQWVKLFNENPQMTKSQSVQYIKGYHNLLSSLFMLQFYSKYCEILNEFEALEANKDVVNDQNTEILMFKYLFTGHLNRILMEGSFRENQSTVKNWLDRLAQYKDKIDPERAIHYYYKVASVYFGADNYDQAIFYLNKINSFKKLQIREDILCFARILSLIAHYEKGDDLEYQIKATFQFIGKMNDQQAVQKEVFKFLRKSTVIIPSELKGEFVRLYDRLETHKNNIYERRPFLYLDILSWLESKIKDRPLQDIVQEKFKSLK